MRSFPRWLIVATGLVVLTLIGGGYWFYIYQEETFRENSEANLQAAAELKVNQIAEWRSEKLRDAEAFTASPLLNDAVDRWLANPQSGLAEKILSQFSSTQQLFHYRDVILVDRAGQVRLSLRKHHGSLHEEAARSLVEALRDGRPVMTDLHAGPANLPPHIDVIAPLFPETDKTKDPNGAVILQIDARQFLYPLIQFWPTPSVSAETLLVRKEGDAVLFLNDLRHRPDTAFKLRIPLSNKNVPAVMAVLGKEGIVQGTDYRGVTVLSVLKAIPNSPWFMVAKMDEAEALAGWRFRAILILVLVIALLAFLFSAVGVVWQKTGKAYYKELFIAETALRKAQEGHRITLMSVGDGIISTDADGLVEILNPVAEALTGWRQEEACGKPLEEVFRIFNEKTRQPVENPVSRVLSEGLIVGLENHTVLVSRDGTEHPIADSAAPIRDEPGEILGVVLVFRDQSEQRAAQRLLTQEKEKAQQYLEVAGVILLALDTNGQVTLLNRKGCEILGYQEGDILGKDWFENFLPDKVRDEIKGTFSRIISGHLEMDRHLESIVLTSGGETRLIAWNNSILIDQDGSIIGTLSSGEDITERKQTEESLRRSEELLRTIIGAAPVGITLSVDRKLVWVNDAWNMIFGLEQDGAGEGPISARTMYPTQEEFERVGKLLYESLEIGGIGESDATMIRKDGTIFDAHIAMKAVDPSDFSKGSIGIIMDMTARKEAEQERESLRNQLSQAQKMESIGTLAGGIAHDFNNLLTIINGYTEMVLSEKTEDDPAYSDLQKILETGQKGADLVRRLLAFSRKGEFNPQPLNLNRVVEDSVALMERSFPKMIEIETILEKDVGKVNADAAQVEQVLMNISINAKEAMPEGGRLRIETRNVALDEAYCKLYVSAKPGPHVVIEVADTGAGMNTETLGRVFDPFFSTKGWDFNKGTGLGLSVAKGIVEQHGGWITCECELGKGSTFTVYFPAIETQPIHKKPEAETTATTECKKILLVDDEQYIRDLGKRILERSGYTAITASTGKEALEIYAREQSKIGLVVLDLIMPQMGGEKCLEELLKINPHLKVIVSTGHSLAQKELDRLSFYAKGFASKPYQMKEFVEVVRGVLPQDNLVGTQERTR